MAYGEAMRRMRQREKRNEKLNKGKLYPKGFDVTLADVISDYNFSQEQIQRLGQMTVDREIAKATVGRNVYYRRETIERVFGVSLPDGE